MNFQGLEGMSIFSFSRASISAKQRTIVDLKAKKRVKSCDSSVVKHLDQPKEKIPTLVKNQLYVNKFILLFIAWFLSTT